MISAGRSSELGALDQLTELAGGLIGNIPVKRITVLLRPGTGPLGMPEVD